MDKSLCRRSGRHLAYVSGRHGRVEVFRATSDKDRKEICVQVHILLWRDSTKKLDHFDNMQSDGLAF